MTMSKKCNSRCRSCTPSVRVPVKDTLTDDAAGSPPIRIVHRAQFLSGSDVNKDMFDIYGAEDETWGDGRETLMGRMPSPTMDVWIRDQIARQDPANATRSLPELMDSVAANHFSDRDDASEAHGRNAVSFAGMMPAQRNASEPINDSLQCTKHETRTTPMTR